MYNNLSRKTKMLWPGQENTIQKTIIWPLGLRSRFQEGHYGTWHTTLWSCTHIPNIIDKNVMAQTRKYYLKNNSFDLEVKGQGPTKVITVCDTPPYEDAPTYQISLTYLKRNNYLTLRSKVKVQRRSLRYATHRLMVMHPHTKYHWPISKETIIWSWGQRSRSHEGHYGTQHTALWSCTHIPNIIDLSWKTKMLWPGQENTI